MNINKKLVQAFIVVAVTMILIPMTAVAVDFSKSELARLQSGRTVIRYLPSSGKSGFYGGTGYALVDAPIKEVWAAIQNWSDYGKMFPNIDDCQAVSRKGNRTLVRMRIGHPVVSVQFHVETITDAAKHTMRFDLVKQYPHDLESIRGYWRLFPQSGNRTLVVYVASVQAPMGIVMLAGDELARSATRMLLSIPGDVGIHLKKKNRK